MWIQTFFKSLTSTSTRRRPTHRNLPAWQIEPLEDRCLLSNYIFTDLATPGSINSVATDLNASGQVVGTLSPGILDNYPDNSTPERAVLWHDGGMIDLGTLGGRHSSAFGINDVGQVVGRATTSADSIHAFLVTPVDTDGNGTPDLWYRDNNGDGANDLMRDLGANDGIRSVARDVNNAGQVVGTVTVTPGVEHAFLWRDGTMTDLGTLDGGPSHASAINDAGQVVGMANMGDSQHVFLWANGVMTDLGIEMVYALPFVGVDVVPVDINAAGKVAAGIVVWTPTTPNGTVGTLTTYLPPLPEAQAYMGSSHAFGLDNAGQVVGSSWWNISYDAENPMVLFAATFWADGAPQDISENLAYSYGAAINDAGQIIANGQWGGAVLLTPIPDDVPRAAISDATVTEGNNGTRLASFTVTLSTAYGEPVSVAYATASGAAIAGSDYQAVSGTLTILAGETIGMITVPVSGDRLGEPNETFFLNLASPTNSTIVDGQGMATIVDDEPRISIGDVTKSEGKKGQTTLFTFTITLSATYDQPVTMSFRTVNGTAKTGDNDYVAKTGTLTFAPGETTKSITIEVKGDSKREAHESYFVDLYNNSGNSLFTKNRGLGTILNDD